MPCKELKEHFAKNNLKILMEHQNTEEFFKLPKKRLYFQSTNIISEMNTPYIGKLLFNINNGGKLVPLTHKTFVVYVTKEGWVHRLYAHNANEQEHINLFFELKSCFLPYRFDCNLVIRVRAV